MAYTASQIVQLSAQIAKVPGYLALGGQLLNTILEELWMVYDFAFSRQKIYIDLTKSQPTDSYGQPFGYALPANHERTLEVYYVVNNAPRAITQLPIEQYDSLFQGVSGSSYPECYAVDVAQSPRTFLVYPLPPLATGVYMRYVPQQTAITTPETSSVTPWFPQQLYLIKRLAAELMMISDDSRAKEMREDAADILSKFLTMGTEDRENYAIQVKLDPRMFKNKFSDKNTKQQPL